MHLEMASTKARHHEVTSSEACRGIVKVHCCQEKADRQLELTAEDTQDVQETSTSSGAASQSPIVEMPREGKIGSEVTLRARQPAAFFAKPDFTTRALPPTEHCLHRRACAVMMKNA